MLLSPKQVNSEIKKELTKNGIKFSSRDQQQPAAAEREYRKIPSKRLIARLGLTRYDVPAGISEEAYCPDRVYIPLRQHIGAPAVPTVKEGQCKGNCKKNRSIYRNCSRRGKRWSILNRAIGVVEFNSIAKGIEAADYMLKAARVEALFCRTVCPGKFVTMVGGDVAAVESAVRTGVEQGSQAVVDRFVLPSVHESVFRAITGVTPVTEMKSLGIIETFSLSSVIVAADIAVKAAEVELLEIRLGLAIGGKAFVMLNGDVGAVKAAVTAGAGSAAEKGLLVSQVVIPSPSKDLITQLL
jgi:microcompartment protein CcmL/EutN